MSNDWPAFTLDSLAKLPSSHVETTNACLMQILEPTAESILASAREKPALYDAYISAYKYLGSGTDHMAAIAAVPRSDPLPYLAPYTLSRGVLEAAARAYWLIELGLGSGTRIARALLDRMDSVWSHSCLHPPGDPYHDEMQAHVKARTAMIPKEARAAHLKVSLHGAGDRQGQPQRMARETRPRETAAVDALLKWVYGVDHRWFYSYLSGFAHSSIYSLMQGTEVMEDQGSGFKILRARVNMMQLGTTTIACAHCHATVLHLLSEAAGYPDSPESPLETVKSQ